MDFMALGKFPHQKEGANAPSCRWMHTMRNYVKNVRHCSALPELTGRQIAEVFAIIFLQHWRSFHRLHL
jgi:hypothetical protein